MDFDAVNFLMGLFGGDTVPSGTDPDPQGSDNAPALEEKAGSPAPRAAGPEPAPEPFAGWVLRSDVSGRLGWEAPGLPEAARWWADSRFEDLPAVEFCPKCGGVMWWWTVGGDRRCMVCDPPTAAIRLLERAERIRRRLGIPSPAGAAERLAELRRLAHPPVGALSSGQPTARPEPEAAVEAATQ